MDSGTQLILICFILPGVVIPSAPGNFRARNSKFLLGNVKYIVIQWYMEKFKYTVKGAFANHIQVLYHHVQPFLGLAIMEFDALRTVKRTDFCTSGMMPRIIFLLACDEFR